MVKHLAPATAACALFLAGANAANACEQDNDCKNGRTCINGACVAAPASMPASASPLVGVRCARDKDCPGDDTCTNGVCAPPGAPQSSAPAAPPPSAAAPPPPPPSSSRSCERDGDCSLADVCVERRCVPYAQRKSAPPPADTGWSPAASSPSAPAAQPDNRGSTGMMGGLLSSPSSPTPPSAPGARVPFGKRGQIVPLGYIVFESTSYSYPDTSPPGNSAVTSRTTIGFSPGLEVFVADNFFLGFRLGVSKTSSSNDGGASNDATSAYLGPLVGFNAPFSDLVSLEVSAALYYHSQGSSSSDSAGNTSNKVDVSWLSAALQAQLLFHVASHMFLGFGPYYEREFNTKYTREGMPDVDGSNRGFLGLSTVIGSWF